LFDSRRLHHFATRSTAVLHRVARSARSSIETPSTDVGKWSRQACVAVRRVRVIARHCRAKINRKSQLRSDLAERSPRRRFLRMPSPRALYSEVRKCRRTGLVTLTNVAIRLIGTRIRRESAIRCGAGDLLMTALHAASGRNKTAARLLRELCIPEARVVLGRLQAARHRP
jgi:hypothetical protein